MEVAGRIDLFEKWCRENFGGLLTPVKQVFHVPVSGSKWTSLNYRTAIVDLGSSGAPYVSKI